MDYYCEICDICIKLNSKYKHFKSNTHKEFDKCKHIKLTFKNPDINNIDKTFQAYNMQHFKKYGYYLLKCEFNLVFNDNQKCPNVTSKIFDNRTMISWSN